MITDDQIKLIRNEAATEYPMPAQESLRPVIDMLRNAYIKGATRHMLTTWGKEILDFGRIVINPETHQVIINQSPVPGFVKKQFDILYLLASRPGRLFTRLEILKTVWQKSEYRVNERTVDVYIKNIRAVIGPANIGTVKGMGYKFIP